MSLLKVGPDAHLSEGGLKSKGGKKLNKGNGGRV